jgi:hypothetical protein
MTLLLSAAPVGGSVPAVFANPLVMAVGLVILIGIFAWLMMKE